MVLVTFRTPNELWLFFWDVERQRAEFSFALCTLCHLWLRKIDTKLYQSSTRDWGCTLWRNKDSIIKSLSHLALITWFLELESLLIHTGILMLTNMWWYFMVLYFGRRFLPGHEPTRSSVLYLSVPQKVESLALCVHSVCLFNMSFSWSGPSKVKWISSGLSY